MELSIYHACVDCNTLHKIKYKTCPACPRKYKSSLGFIFPPLTLEHFEDLKKLAFMPLNVFMSTQIPNLPIPSSLYRMIRYNKSFK